jgi:anti-anti-sigma factor
MAVRVVAGELQPGIRVVALSGRLDMECAEADYPVVRDALEESAAGIVVHLGAVEFVSSSGFRMLLALYQEARAAGKVVILTRPRPSVYKIFKVAALDTKLPFCEEHEVGPIDAYCQLSALSSQPSAF